MLTGAFLLLIVFCGILPGATTAAEKPETIPAVQEWTPGTGSFTLSSAAHIVLRSDDADSLQDAGETFAGDLKELTNLTITVVTAAAPASGDIFLSLDTSDTTVGDEGYLLHIDSTLHIRASAVAGAFYGTRTILQLLRQSMTIDCGVIRDRPVARWRGLHIDLGRKYFTLDWIKDHIKDMAYVKKNLLHLHLSDALIKENVGGFRLESSSHPEIVSVDHYTKAEIGELIDLAAKYQVTILPEIDLPGHASWAYAAHKGLLLPQRVLGDRYWAFDLSIDSVYTFINELLDEFIPLFPGPYWHLGADEYMTLDEYGNFPRLSSYAKSIYGQDAHPNDCYRHFVNWAHNLINEKGKITWTWNDVLLGVGVTSAGVCSVATDIYSDHWSNLNWFGWGGSYPSKAYDRGQMLMNSAWDNYYIVGKDLNTGNPKTLYDNFEVYTFDGGTLPEGDPQILGSKMCIWCDVPDAETEEEIAENTFELMRAHAQKAWSSPKLMNDYAGFKTLAYTLVRAPGTSISPTGINNKKIPDNQVIFHNNVTVQVFNVKGALVQTVTLGPADAQLLVNRKDTMKSMKNSLGAGAYLCRIGGNFRMDNVFLVLVP